MLSLSGDDDRIVYLAQGSCGAGREVAGAVQASGSLEPRHCPSLPLRPTGPGARGHALAGHPGKLAEAIEVRPPRSV